MSQRQDEGHEALRANIAAYALGALGADEHNLLEEHLADCAACRGELRWLAPAIDVLPASVEQREPPQRLKRELMRVVERDVAEARREERIAERKGFAARVLGLSALRPAIGLATVLLVVAGVAIGVLATQSEDRPDEETTTLQARGLGGADVDASLAVSDPTEGGTLRVGSIDPVDRGHVYQLWVQRDGDYQPSSLFVPREDGSAEAAVTQSLEGADAVLMTEEPRGGSDQPSSPVYASVALGT